MSPILRENRSVSGNRPRISDLEIVLDLSRLVSRMLHATPTGVDRVEMAYARELAKRMADRLHFAVVHPNGLYGRLSGRAVTLFLDQTEAVWDNAGVARGAMRWIKPFLSLLALNPRPVPRLRPGTRRIYLQVSPHHLEHESRVVGILRREQAKLVCLVHDLIPIEYPEYARAGGAELHRRRISTVLRHADGIITNSAATRDALAPFIAASGRSPRLCVAHLGVRTDLVSSSPPDPAVPYFVCVGTIEPRKNHLLLLNIWRSMAEEAGNARIPKLVIIGRRGWENEQVVDMLERCPALNGHVEEHGRLPDREMRRLLAGARALLMPSFTEGYGMPVSEALALGTPVICSDLPALHEAGGDLPCYIDPLDGIGWLAAIKRAAVVRTAPAGAPALPSWSEHIATVEDLIHEVAGRGLGC